ncbi:geranylgeranyl reductase family [Chitinophaga ginsengisegetis]|uniref:Geranylgeranyl reductase family n=1 Tax=Chitinophaga ginsengisegetis TaxID=393003 RepID=A0A1T5P646_9BACT|nr:geranylgeranyl reductase family protein [Chitinophaga ginsengisegetis]MDR6566282.1 geranylgeranyl reductase family protein [Chitinophaga ginsengisegetis]MDR6646012.1 geranylgeranyl reductase family protein [Chitinophaga ginsengisegetis]MDR6651396.1 geranylgeranyl reductase family protein [Chitinophaga ginsengisegetis]SKD08181.1 geranylgeranyl reductase family [Chitinophaga ginsengisegetis]
METKVCIIGAGPGGATAALQLAQLGIECIVVDKAVFPRDKVCGDGLSGKVLTLLERIDKGIGQRLQEAMFKADSWGVTFVAPNRIGMDIPYRLGYQEDKSNPRGFVCKRIDFDNFLVDEMKRRSEIRLFEGTSIDKYELKPDGYHLSSKDGSFKVKADVVIVANGAHSGFTRDVAGIKMEPKHYVAGIRAYYKGITGLHKDNFIELHFLKNMLPGYIWIFPLPNGEANVGVGMLSNSARNKKVNLKQLMLDTIATDPVMKERFKNAELTGSIDGYGLPLGSKKRKLHGERYMLVGDAGFLIDPFTGEGIGNALYSGRIAAQQAAAAIAANDYSDTFFNAYDEHVYRILGPELQVSTKLQKLIKYPWLFNMLMKMGSRNKQLKDLMSCMFHEVDLRKKLGQPMFYVKLLFNR